MYMRNHILLFNHNVFFQGFLLAVMRFLSRTSFEMTGRSFRMYMRNHILLFNYNELLRIFARRNVISQSCLLRNDREVIPNTYEESHPAFQL